MQMINSRHINLLMKNARSLSRLGLVSKRNFASEKDIYRSLPALKERLQSVRDGSLANEGNYVDPKTGHLHMSTKDFAPDTINDLIDELRQQELFVTKCNTFKFLNLFPLDPTNPQHQHVIEMKRRQKEEREQS